MLEGELLLEIDGRVHSLVAGDYAVMPIATPHTLAAGGGGQVRWLSVNTPPRRPPTWPVPDTFFGPEPPDVAALAAAAVPLTVADVVAPARRALRGHAAAGRGAPAGRRPASAAPRPAWTPRSSPTAGSR